MKYKTKPKVIEAIRFNGFGAKLSPGLFGPYQTPPDWIQEGIDKDLFIIPSDFPKKNSIKLKTKQGEVCIKAGDYIIRNTNGSFAICEGKLFEEIFEKNVS